jgi:hypothetical protein
MAGRHNRHVAVRIEQKLEMVGGEGMVLEAAVLAV